MTKIRQRRDGEGRGGGRTRRRREEEERGGGRTWSREDEEEKEEEHTGFLTTHTRSFLWPEPHMF